LRPSWSAAHWPAAFGLLLDHCDSYAAPWAVFAPLAASVTAATFLAGPAIDRERRLRAITTFSHRRKQTMKILVIHGAGMNMRGKVQTEVFGTLTLPEYDVKIRAYAAALGWRSRSSIPTSKAR
jgi:hypothetical protein